MSATAAAAAIAPHRFYYLHNFCQALDWIRQRYSDLLAAPEYAWLQQFHALPQPSQALLVRMLMRRGPWFRASKLQYDEIGDTAQAAAPLLALQWLQADADMDVATLFDLYTRAELQHILRAQALPAQQRKQDWLQTLQAQGLPARPYAQWHPEATETGWRLSDSTRTLCERFRLMFFGNLRQDWSEFVLADLGIFRYESVPLTPAARAFQCRENVDTYLAMQVCREALHAETVDAAALMEQLAQCASSNPWLERRRSRLLMQLGQACEKARDWQAAQAVYAQCRYPGARHRLVRVLELQGEHAPALALAQAALQTPESEEEQQKLQRMLPRLLRHTGTPAPRQRARAAVVEDSMRIDICLPLPATACSVEVALRNHWHADDAPVFYVENTLITALFGLLCWPAIFAPVQGAFFHPFQSAPADFSTPDFVPRRADVFAQCLAQLQDGRYRATIVQRFADKHGLQNPFVVWQVLDAEVLQLALDCIPATHLQRMFERLLADPRNHRTGLPDLIRFWPAEQRYAMVEVKAPGDKLQDNQIRWLQFFAQHGIPAQVCHVTWHTEAATALCA